MELKNNSDEKSDNSAVENIGLGDEKKDLDTQTSMSFQTVILPSDQTEKPTKENLEEKKLFSESLAVKDKVLKKKEKIIDFLKKERNWIYYLILGVITFVGVYIRTRNISKLKDVATGEWTLGPDLDPFLFLRWTEYIVEHGSLMVHDAMRYVPVGYNTAGEMKLLAYMIAWLYKFLAVFSKDMTVTYAANLFPVVMFGLTTIAFFIFTRKIFYKENKKTKNIIALIATAFFVVIPSLLPRTIAGVPEKESASFFFMFLALYFILEAFTSEKKRTRWISGILSGVMTGLMALIWGGVIFVFLPISGAILFAFILGKIRWKEFSIGVLWLISSFIVMMPFSTRYSFRGLLEFKATMITIGIFALIGMSLFIMKSEKLNSIRKRTKLPKPLFALIISGLILLIIFLVISPGFVLKQLSLTKHYLIEPSITRFSFTVSENQQPYFAEEWANSFGPIIKSIPLFFSLFFIGSVLLFNELISKLKRKEKILLTGGYFVFLAAIALSRYAKNSVFNGENWTSHLFYFGGIIFFLGAFIYVYYKRYNEGEFYIFKEFNFPYILYLTLLTLSFFGTRGAIRMIMILGAISPVMIGFIFVKISQKYAQEKGEFNKFFIRLVLIAVVASMLLSFYLYFKLDMSGAKGFAPNPEGYQGQWQRAMQWVRDNTQKDAVFAHWWDYGYWLQTMGKRATILDGGNRYVYWNHLFARHVLTGKDERKTLEFLYSHNATHLLIDFREIDKYPAFSSIGSNETYDRYSWITEFVIDERRTQKTENGTNKIYFGAGGIDEDIIWEDNFLPKGYKSYANKELTHGVGAIILKEDADGNFLQPEAVFVYNGKPQEIPLKYLYTAYNKELIEFESGLDAGVFIYPRIITIENEEIHYDPTGSLFYLSGRVIHSNLANLYLFDKESDYFKLVHTETHPVVKKMKESNLELGEFMYFNWFEKPFRGPIKIWEINYPSDIKVNPEFLETEYPNLELEIARKELM